MNKKEAGNQDENKTDGKKEMASGAQEQSQGMGALQPQQQQMLDRLEDHPGRAMMPAYSGGRVGKRLVRVIPTMMIV